MHLIDLPKIEDSRGNLTFVQEGVGCPFPIKRVFWTHNIPGGSIRGGHAFKRQHELVVALSGSFDVVVSSDAGDKRFRLSRGYQGLYLPPLTWRRLEDFSTNGVSLHLSSIQYDGDDYIRDFEDFKRLNGWSN